MIERRPRILVVEDEESLLSTLMDELGADGFTVDPALSGEEGLRKIESHQPDLIILDLLLGRGYSGLDVLAKLKAQERTRSIPVVILSNVGDEEKIQEALEMGAAEYYVKTRYDLVDIGERLHHLLGTGRG